VCVAAVILDPARPIAGLGDSKQLSERRREALYPQIMECALAWRIEFVEAAEIDARNILQATMAGMRRAIAALSPAAVHALVDGNRIPDGLSCPATAIIDGDALEPAIMAASILAKVARDARMRALHLQYPAYGFDRHKGYPSPLHREALRLHGPCPEHRRSFAPVRDALAAAGLSA
ncbi:MAG: ribonuclease HII, partial [Xanthomonadales bacterium]|nr:ribonuclease HII [Xanthomonadales bacterium]